PLPLLFEERLQALVSLLSDTHSHRHTQPPEFFKPPLGSGLPLAGQAVWNPNFGTDDTPPLRRPGPATRLAGHGPALRFSAHQTPGGPIYTRLDDVPRRGPTHRRYLRARRRRRRGLALPDARAPRRPAPRPGGARPLRGPGAGSLPCTARGRRGQRPRRARGAGLRHGGVQLLP